MCLVFFTSEADGAISAANKAACQLFGMTSEELAEGAVGEGATIYFSLPVYF